MHFSVTFQIIYKQSVTIQRMHVQAAWPSARNSLVPLSYKEGKGEGPMAEPYINNLELGWGGQWKQEELQCCHPWVMLPSPPKPWYAACHGRIWKWKDSVFFVGGPVLCKIQVLKEFSQHFGWFSDSKTNLNLESFECLTMISAHCLVHSLPECLPFLAAHPPLGKNKKFSVNVWQMRHVSYAAIYDAFVAFLGRSKCQ